MSAHYSIGLDYGTNSVRALIVEVSGGTEVATAVWEYSHGNHGVIEDPRDPHLARQHPQDYIDGARNVIRSALAKAAGTDGFTPERVVGIGVDTTGSTPFPVRSDGTPLAFDKRFADAPEALAWLWKDHTAVAEAEEITDRASSQHPEYLAKCGGVYSSEWYWAKLLHCARTAPEIFSESYTWLEISDWIPATLCGITSPDAVQRSICAAGHKAMYNPQWGGYPDEKFLTSLDPELGRIRRALPDSCYSVNRCAGTLSPGWAEDTGLPAGIPVAVGAFDAHLGGVGAGIRPGVMVKSLGTSTCDILIADIDTDPGDIPGLCGVVPESVVPGSFGLEAGQSAVGDIFNWFVEYIRPGGSAGGSHEELTERASRIQPGQSGLIALDWHNGNRTVLVDQRLTGTILGMTLHTRPEEIYRALIEATAFGARVIMERFEEYNVSVDEIVNCGGIAQKNPLLMQIYADVLKRPLKISRSDQTAALGSAIAGAVVAGSKSGGYDDFDTAIGRMTGVRETVYTPNAEAADVYDRLFAVYRTLHDAFGGINRSADLSEVMKELIRVRDNALAKQG